LATFFDYNETGVYDPSEGDFPALNAGGCSAEFGSRIPDQMFFWIFNDAGGIKTGTSSEPGFFEVRGQAFAFDSDTELAEMTFTRYHLINMGPYNLDSLFMASNKELRTPN
jgi:hypothetical protein